MITKEVAREIAIEHLRLMTIRISNIYGRSFNLMIIDYATIEKKYGWVFFYNSREYLEGDNRMELFGNAPFIVETNGNVVNDFGANAFQPTEETLIEFEKERGYRRRGCIWQVAKYISRIKASFHK